LITDASVAQVAALLADPTRLAILLAHADWRPRPAGELARHAGVPASTARRTVMFGGAGGWGWSWRAWRLALFVNSCSMPTASPRQSGWRRVFGECGSRWLR
jgi:hypothetical protein